MGMIFSLRVGDSLKCGINSANGVSGGMQVMIVAKGWSLRGRGFRPPCRLVPPSAVFSCRIPEILFSKNTYVLDFPEAARRKLVKVAESCRILKPEVEIDLARAAKSGDDDNGEISVTMPVMPLIFDGREFKMGEHQVAALTAWRARGFLGILAHATGSGKTITSIYGAIRVFQATKRLVLGIAVPKPGRRRFFWCSCRVLVGSYRCGVHQQMTSLGEAFALKALPKPPPYSPLFPASKSHVNCMPVAQLRW
jgi:hypothetical protein